MQEFSNDTGGGVQRTVFPDYPFVSHWFPWQDQRLHYLDEGPRTEPTVVLLHGNPTWSFLYRKVIPPLAARYRVLAPDLMGFGLSSKPADVSAHSFAGHVDAVEALLDAHAGERVVLVGHDWGGPIISACGARRPDRVAGLVLMNTYLPGYPLGFWWLQVLFGKPWTRLLVQRLDGFRRLAFRRGFRHRLDADVRRAYDHPHSDPAARAGILAFPGFIPRDPDAHEAADLAAVDHWIETSTAPKLFLYSDRDPVFRQSSRPRTGSAPARVYFRRNRRRRSLPPGGPGYARRRCTARLAGSGSRHR